MSKYRSFPLSTFSQQKKTFLRLTFMRQFITKQKEEEEKMRQYITKQQKEEEITVYFKMTKKRRKTLYNQ
jgi:hypothetical protein